MNLKRNGTNSGERNNMGFSIAFIKDALKQIATEVDKQGEEIDGINTKIDLLVELIKSVKQEEKKGK